MKRCIAATALALLAFPCGALAAPDLRTEQHVNGGSLGVAPGVMPQLQAKGTDVAAPDQQASPRSTAPTVEFLADDESGFDWADAGIGAAAAASLMGVSLAGGMALRRRHRGPALPPDRNPRLAAPPGAASRRSVAAPIPEPRAAPLRTGHCSLTPLPQGGPQVPRSTILRRGAVAAAVLALAGAAGAEASRDRGGDRWYPRDDSSRMLYATTDENLLLQLNERSPERLRDVKVITGLPAGVTLRGIDFRPATGDLYGVGSDNVVYRVNPQTAIAVAEGPAFTPGLRGTSFGVDFNPTVDKIRVVSDAQQNLRLNVDEGTVLSADKDLNPGMPQAVGAAYTNSSFTATRPTATQLFVVDAATDQLFLQNPPNDGTLTMPKRLGIDVGSKTGFDIAGADNTGYLATSNPRSRGSALYKVDVTTGKTRTLGRIGGGKRIVVTGLAAWQD